MTGVLIKRKNLDTGADTHTRRPPCEDEGRDHGDTSISQGMLKTSNKPQEGERQEWNRFSLTDLRRNQLYLYIDLRLLVSRAV